MPMTPEKVAAVQRFQEQEKARLQAVADKEAARQKAYLEAQRQAELSNALSSARKKLNRLGSNMQMQQFLDRGMNPLESTWFRGRAARGFAPVALNTSAGLTPIEQQAVRNAGIDRSWVNQYFDPESAVNKNLPTIFGYSPDRQNNLPPTPAPSAPAQGIAALSTSSPATPTPGMQTTQMAGYNPRQARNVTMHKAKKGGSIQAYASGGAVKSRGDGCAQRGKTKGKIV
jgi:hypothetical protein